MFFLCDIFPYYINGRFYLDFWGSLIITKLSLSSSLYLKCCISFHFLCVCNGEVMWSFRTISTNYWMRRFPFNYMSRLITHVAQRFGVVGHFGRNSPFLWFGRWWVHTALKKVHAFFFCGACLFLLTHSLRFWTMQALLFYVGVDHDIYNTI